MDHLILDRIPQHNIYIEPFVGGGLFWNKPRVKCEIINDTNSNVTNIYEVIKNKRLFEEFVDKISTLLHSRTYYKFCIFILDNPTLYTKVERAVAFYVCTNQGFSSMIGSWKHDVDGQSARTFQSKCKNISQELSERLHTMTIEEYPAEHVISMYDRKEAFVYADPPYINTNQGHYNGYKEADYRRLLDVLVKLKGKFLLSSYPNDVLTEYAEAHSWGMDAINMSNTVVMARNGEKRTRKTELLISNY